MTSSWAWWRLKSPASRLFTQPFIHAQIKENINVPPHWPLCGEITSDRWIPRTKGQQRGNASIWWRHHAFAIHGHYNTNVAHTLVQAGIIMTVSMNCGMEVNYFPAYTQYDVTRRSFTCTCVITNDGRQSMQILPRMLGTIMGFSRY